MYPITRESVMAAISSSVAEKAVCWWDGRKKRKRRILRRLTHLAIGGRVIGGAGIGEGNLGFGNNAGEHSCLVYSGICAYFDCRRAAAWFATRIAPWFLASFSRVARLERAVAEPDHSPISPSARRACSS